MKDFEIREFTDTQEVNALEYFKEQENTDRWVRVYTIEMETAPLENCRLKLLEKDAFSYTSRNGINIPYFSKDVNEDDITSSMENSKLSLVFPDQDQMQMYPIRYTAFGHIQDRAGITGSSISSLKERKRAYEIAPEKRSKMLNEGLKLYTDRSLILIRDGKATAILSGDESDYCIMPIPEILAVMKEELKQYQFSFLKAATSHEISLFEYRIYNPNIESQIRNELMMTEDNEITLKLVLTSSDVGKCSVQLRPDVEINHVPVPIGRTLSTTHKGKNAMEVFQENCKKFLARYNMNLEYIKKMNSICINKPASCMKNLYESLKLAGYSSAFKEVLKKIEQEHVSSCSAFDIYYYFCSMLSIEQEIRSRDKKGEISLYDSAKAKDIISELLFINISSFDY